MDEIGNAGGVGKEFESQQDCIIDLESVSVRWPESEKNAINNISFNFNSAKLLAIVGHVGCGKVIFTYIKN